ncbi:MAG: protein kinase [Myxococcota bacterium]
MPGLGEPRYRVGRCIGTGATGVVYEAFDSERAVTVALKTLHTADPLGLRRLKHEFRALADIAHPNLVGLHELVSTDDGSFVTMDLVDGVPFLLWVRGEAARRRAEPTFELAADAEPLPYVSHAPPRGRPPPDPDRLRDAFRQLCQGVQALHAHGSLHRDLKPSNVLVERSTGRVVLLDFGLLQALEPVGGAALQGPVVGTVPYMSPEQAAGAPLTEASDWYAVGTMLFEALTGERPFTGPVAQVVRDKQVRPPPDPAELCDVPDDLGALCRALLAVAPQERPDGPTVLAAFGGDPISTPPSVGLIGRTDELDALSTAWARVARGDSVLVAVRGPSGIGKTALVERFLSTLQAPVLAGRCYERESVAYRALDSVVDALAERLGGRLPDVPELASVGALFPVLQPRATPVTVDRTSDPHERRARGFRGLQRLIASLAPLCVFVDDAQWGDPDSAGFFAELLSGTPVLVVLTWRTEEQDQSAFLAALQRLRVVPAVTVEVGTLRSSEAVALASALRPAASPDTLDRIAHAADGHPLFVHELARSGTDPDHAATLDEAIRRASRSSGGTSGRSWPTPPWPGGRSRRARWPAPWAPPTSCPSWPSCAPGGSCAPAPTGSSRTTTACGRR